MKHVSPFLIILFLLASCTPPLPTNIPLTPVPIQPSVTAMPPTPRPEPTAVPAPQVRLRRGINLDNLIESPNNEDGGTQAQEEYFDLIQDAGFDFIRLPVRWSAHAEEAWPYTVDPTFFARVDDVVGWALARDLAVILDFHDYEEMAGDPWSHKDRFLEIWKQVSGHYAESPATVLFELLNEPNDQLNASLWNQYLRQALAIVRESNPDRDVVIGPSGWNAYDWVSTLDVPDDEHLIVTFHYYLPFEFTHQGAEWVDGADAWMGTSWEATDEQEAEVRSHFDTVADWAVRHGNIRILLGEFGAYSKANQEDRVRWTTFVREQAEAHGFAWAYWEFNAGFGIYDPEAEEWREDLLHALIP